MAGCSNHPLRILLGKFNVIDRRFGMSSPNRGYILQRSYNTYKEWSHLGIVSLSESLPEPGLLEPADMRQPGQQPTRIIKSVTVEPGEKGKILGKIGDTAADNPYAAKWINKSSLLIEPKTCNLEIVRNEPATRGMDEYRVIYFTVSIEWPQCIPKFNDLEDTGFAVFLFGGKYRFLYKYDFFSRSWKYMAQDFARLNRDFEPESSVARELSK
jgi:hypothetical protein